jgi:hypothetical protein
MRRLLIAMLAFTCLGCPKTVTPPPAGPPPEDSDPAKCAEACTVITLKCPKTKLAEDKPCVEACRQVESSGYLTIHPKCIAEAVDVSGIRACNFDCKE